MVLENDAYSADILSFEFFFAGIISWYGSLCSCLKIRDALTCPSHLCWWCIFQIFYLSLLPSLESSACSMALIKRLVLISHERSYITKYKLVSSKVNEFFLLLQIQILFRSKESLDVKAVEVEMQDSKATSLTLSAWAFIYFCLCWLVRCYNLICNLLKSFANSQWSLFKPWADRI